MLLHERQLDARMEYCLLDLAASIAEDFYLPYSFECNADRKNEAAKFYA